MIPSANEFSFQSKLDIIDKHFTEGKALEILFYGEYMYPIKMETEISVEPSSQLYF